MSQTEDKPRVLVVDDVAENVRIMLETLRTQFAVIAATTGEKALELAVSSSPEVILLDVMMPGLDGFEVCQLLKANAATREIPVLFVSSLGESHHEFKGLELGAADYIHKPFDPSLVRARVRHHVTLYRAINSLKQQKQALEEAARLREEVDRIARHDLKGPLTGIINIPQLLLMDDNLNGEQRRLLGFVEEAGYQILEQIDRSLDLYRMETGTYPFHPERVDLLTTLSRIEGNFTPILRQHKISIRLEGGGEPFLVHGEPLLCHSLFSNLIKNALEASPKGGEIFVTLAREGGEGKVVIHNQGTVPAQIRAHFFDKYVTASKVKGSGLGTYSAQLIAKTQGGRITMETSEETGTTVTVFLPAF